MATEFARISYRRTRGRISDGFTGKRGDVVNINLVLCALDKSSFVSLVYSFPNYTSCLCRDTLFVHLLSILYYPPQLHSTMAPHVVPVENQYEQRLADLREFGITRNAFLPAESPSKLLSDSYYEPWELVARNLSELIDDGAIRDVVAQLPTLQTDRLSSEADWRRAFVILAYITHAYVWGGDKPEEVSQFPGHSYRNLLTLGPLGIAAADNNPLSPRVVPPRAPSCAHLRRRQPLELYVSPQRLWHR